MKMVVAVVQDKDAHRLSNALVKEGIRATKLASTGGFLRAGNTTFLIGVEDEKVEDVMRIIQFELPCTRSTGHTGFADGRYDRFIHSFPR